MKPIVSMPAQRYGFRDQCRIGIGKQRSIQAKSFLELLPKAGDKPT